MVIAVSTRRWPCAGRAGDEMVPPSLMSASPETTTYWLVTGECDHVASNHGPGSAGRAGGDGRGADGITGGVGFDGRAVPAVLVTIWPDSRTFRSLMRVITPWR